jgi:catechol 2,3-dioxygenase-like lactoylglutathione lyase family enzyme
LIDHVGLFVSDYDESKAFYCAALEPLGFELVCEQDGWAGIGCSGRSIIWIKAGLPTKPVLHLAFKADARALVDDFYQAALAAGGKDNGPPGLRSHYHSHYYAAFVLDPDGHNIEVVCHRADAREIS